MSTGRYEVLQLSKPGWLSELEIRGIILAIKKTAYTTFLMSEMVFTSDRKLALSTLDVFK